MQAKRIRAQRLRPPSDPLVLAAVDRAHRHRFHQDYGDATLTEIARHLGITWGPHASRRLRPIVRRLTAELGWLRQSRHRGQDRWALTDAGAERLARALLDGVAEELPESPQHRRWREAREHALARIEALKSELGEALAKANAMLNAEAPAPAADWLACANALRELTVAVATASTSAWSRTTLAPIATTVSSRAAARSAGATRKAGIPAMATDRAGGGERARASKVVGLGAPISVRIFFDASEIPALWGAIDDELGRYGATSLRDGHLALRGDAAEYRDHVDELRRMLDDVQRAAVANARGGFEVLWPTVLARGVVDGAVRHGQRHAGAATAEDAAAAREALAAAERTRRDFDAVDKGGLGAVWL